MKRLFKDAANLGDANIPSIFVKNESSKDLITLYWREPAQDDKTLEIWNTQDNTFVLVEGDFSDGEWGQEDVKIVEEVNNVRDAINLAQSNYLLLQNEEPEPQTARIKKRLIRKRS